MQYQLTLLVLTLVVINGCSYSGAYYGAQQAQINQCLQTMSHAKYSDCINQSNKSYDEYSLERKEVIDK